MKSKVKICQDCKRIWITDLLGNLKINCKCGKGSSIFVDTHESNRINL